jgi:hypothetical protein
MSDSELAVVAVFPNRIAAEMAQGALMAEGIESVVSADDAGGVYASLWVNGVRLLVRAEDADNAQQVLATGDATGAEPGTT